MQLLTLPAIHSQPRTFQCAHKNHHELFQGLTGPVQGT